MKTADVGMDMAGPISHGFREEFHGAMVHQHPRIKDILSGIILLAAGGKESLPLEKVHSIIHAMKSHEPILSGLRFSVTGAVCYSRDIDQTINFLTDGGFIEVVDGTAFLGEHAPEFRNYLSRFLTNSQIQTVHSASLRFHDRVRRDGKEARDRM